MFKGMVMLYKRNILKFFVMMDFWIYIFYFDCLRNFFDFFDDYGIVIRECVGKNYIMIQRKILKFLMIF